MQNKYNNINGELPCILVGDMRAAFAKGKDLSASDFVHTLSYKNIISNAMKKEMNSNIGYFGLLVPPFSVQMMPLTFLSLGLLKDHLQS